MGSERLFQARDFQGFFYSFLRVVSCFSNSFSKVFEVFLWFSFLELPQAGGERCHFPRDLVFTRFCLRFFKGFLVFFLGLFRVCSKVFLGFTKVF